MPIEPEASTPMIEQRGLTLVGVSLTNLGPGGWVQLPLPFVEYRDLDATLDAVRERFAKEWGAREDPPDADFSSERVLLGREAIALLTQAIRQLPERTRDILILRSLEGLKHGEIARLQGISVRSVEKHMARALAHLSQTLGRVLD